MSNESEQAVLDLVAGLFGMASPAEQSNEQLLQGIATSLAVNPLVQSDVIIDTGEGAMTDQDVNAAIAHAQDEKTSDERAAAALERIAGAFERIAKAQETIAQTSIQNSDVLEHWKEIFPLVTERMREMVEKGLGKSGLVE